MSCLRYTNLVGGSRYALCAAAGSHKKERKCDIKIKHVFNVHVHIKIKHVFNAHVHIKIKHVFNAHVHIKIKQDEDKTQSSECTLR